MSNLRQISQDCRGRHPAYICASKLCHIHSATHWTQEVRQTSSDWYDVYCLFSPHRDMQVTGELAVWRCRSPMCTKGEDPFITACSFNFLHFWTWHKLWHSCTFIFSIFEFDTSYDTATFLFSLFLNLMQVMTAVELAVILCYWVRI